MSHRPEQNEQDRGVPAPSSPSGSQASPEAASASSPSVSIPNAERAAFCRAIADRTPFAPTSDNWTRIYLWAGLAYDELTADFAIERSLGQQQIDRLQDETNQLRIDLNKATLSDDGRGLYHSQCEACLAPLFVDDVTLTDDNGCTTCRPAMPAAGAEDDPALDVPQPGPCYAYRSLDRTVALASGTDAPTGGETEGLDPKGDGPAPEGGDAQ